MLKAELLEIIANGENSGVEFKRDDIRPEQLAKEIVAFANVQGGRILLGVEDSGQISGLQRSGTQEWVLNLFRDKVHPQIIPFYEEIVLEESRRVGVITLSGGISKPYVLRHNNREDIYVRMGDRSELATREQQLRLFESGGMLHYLAMVKAMPCTECRGKFVQWQESGVLIMRDINIEKLLENRDTQLLRWDEVRKGLDVFGNPVEVYVTLEATVQDCINIHKLANPAQSCCEELLHEFMAVNWAYVKKIS